MRATGRGLTGAILAIAAVILLGCSANSGSEAASSACRAEAATLFFAPARPPAKLLTPIPRAILSRFALFRAHSGPGDYAGLRGELSRSYELSGYYPLYVRQLREGARRYLVVPAYGRPRSVPSARCLPAGRRNSRARLVAEERRRAARPVYCLLEHGSSSATSAGLGCQAFSQIEADDRVFRTSFLDRGSSVDLVPDGVARVRIFYPEHRPVVVPVADNAALITPPKQPPARLRDTFVRLDPEFIGAGPRLSRAEQARVLEQWNRAAAEAVPWRVEWLDRSGRRLRTMSRPSEAQRAAAGPRVQRAPISG